ncbi:MAG: hypothetical protein DMD44_10540 [Gemmatimonadetes bacterium]|nr:MAG: hypothetical protein DMD44_10540 [Gemmatimonadota bacterium]
MRALHATVVGLLASSIVGAGTACRQSSRASGASDAGALVTVYVPARMADQVMGPLQAVAARHRWALSVRTDSGALADADLTIADSAGRPVARVRAGSAVEAQARQLAKGALP